MFVVTRHRVPLSDREAWMMQAKSAAASLAAQPGCLGVDIGAATDAEDLLCLVSRWKTVGDYRRALSAFDVKLHAIPFLSHALDEPSAFETLHSNVGGLVSDFESFRAVDADSFNLGDIRSDD